MRRPETFEARLVAAKNLTPWVRELVFERADGPLLYDPGQWVNLVLPLPEGEVKRAYSIASAPDGSPRFELAVTRVQDGPGSSFLHEIPEGTTLHTIGPHGLFTRAPDDPTPALFVATGTGVTPLRAMLQAALAAGSTAPMWLLFGARYEEDILYREELDGWARRHPNVRYAITLSRAADGWAGARGYVQGHVPELYRELAAVCGTAAPHVYVCGLERMVKSVRELVRGELGVDRKHVHTERYD
ncbi:ferredoxin--NADP reductase [Polyangium aurulentum]|uniref:ferredoxin--NADP reductase n=1 Tax=Polyangium aurulentum TaxID=2567896 RepID=UPI0010AE1376|nr:FAD-dependent oxidoreductase [Polyangium aurulentum]UQA59309.1 FAD-dependent oxidoreductase [Polyangium aurulentum]